LIKLSLGEESWVLGDGIGGKGPCLEQLLACSLLDDLVGLGCRVIRLDPTNNAVPIVGIMSIPLVSFPQARDRDETGSPFLTTMLFL
jgi:hypothetical protein